MKLQIDLIDLSGNPRNGVFTSQVDADKWLADHVDEFGPNPSVTTTDLTAQDDQQKKVLTRKEKREGCLAVMDLIASINDDSGASDAQMDSFFTSPDMVPIILALVTGAPGAAKRKIAVVGPGIYPQAVVDQIVGMLAALE